MSQSSTLYVGMDVHKESMAVASVAQDHGAEVVSLGTVGPRQCASDKLLRQLRSKRTQLVFVYEAGPCGSWLSRSLMQKGSVCWVVAPSLMPTKAGDRVNTDRRDARQLARRLRAGDLTPVSVPAVDDAAIRDLSRAREETLRALKAAQGRRQACVLRHDIRSPGRANWSPAPLRWRSEVGCPTPAPQLVLQEDVQTVTDQTARWQRLEQALHAQVTVAVTTVAELGDLTRFDNPRQLMQYLGLTPSAYASGARRQPGSMTKTGHTHARRALVEGAWASRYPAQVSRYLQRRLDKLPPAIHALSWQAQVRLCTRYRQRMATGQHAPQVVVAMARALRAFLWAMAKHVARPPQASR